MFRSIPALALVLSASNAFAQDLILKPKATNNQLQLDAKSMVEEGIETKLDDSKRTIPGKGPALDLELALNDRTRIGAGLAYTEFQRYDNHSIDTALGAYAAYDLVQRESWSLYAKGGLSAHRYSMRYLKATNLLNAEVGFGASNIVNENISIGFEYLHGETVVKGDLKAKDGSDYRVKDVSQSRDDYALFLNYKL